MHTYTFEIHLITYITHNYISRHLHLQISVCLLLNNLVDIKGIVLFSLVNWIKNVGIEIIEMLMLMKL